MVTSLWPTCWLRSLLTKSGRKISGHFLRDTSSSWYRFTSTFTAVALITLLLLMRRSY